MASDDGLDVFASDKDIMSDLEMPQPAPPVDFASSTECLTTKCGCVFENFHLQRPKIEVRLSVESGSSAIQRFNFEVSS